MCAIVSRVCVGRIFFAHISLNCHPLGGGSALLIVRQLGKVSGFKFNQLSAVYLCY